MREFFARALHICDGTFRCQNRLNSGGQKFLAAKAPGRSMLVQLADTPLRLREFTMRFLPTTLMILVWANVACAADSVSDSDRLRKAGARVSDDDSLSQSAPLRVSFTSLDDKGAIALRGATRIGALVVEDASRMTDKSLAIIGTLTNLRELNLHHPAMTNSGMASLKGLKQLHKLYLMDAKVYDSGVAYLKGLEHLEELDLTGSNITNAAASTFKTLANLKLLAVLRTKFGDAGVAQLKDLRELKNLEADISVKAAMTLEAEIPGLHIRR